jgi:uncharacterized protein GlcG (DUF336 family)
MGCLLSLCVVGISGGSAQQDQDAAEAATRALGFEVRA